MTLLSATVWGQPVGKGRPRAFKMPNGAVRTHTPKRTRSWESDATDVLARAWNGRPPLDQPVGVRVRAVAQRPKRLCRKKDPDCRLWRTTKPDADNVLKAVGDALTKAGVVRDDTYLAKAEALSLYAARDEGPRVEIELYEIRDLPHRYGGQR